MYVYLSPQPLSSTSSTSSSLLSSTSTSSSLLSSTSSTSSSLLSSTSSTSSSSLSSTSSTSSSLLSSTSTSSFLLSSTSSTSSSLLSSTSSTSSSLLSSTSTSSSLLSSTSSTSSSLLSSTSSTSSSLLSSTSSASSSLLSSTFSTSSSLLSSTSSTSSSLLSSTSSTSSLLSSTSSTSSSLLSSTSSTSSSLLSSTSSTSSSLLSSTSSTSSLLSSTSFTSPSLLSSTSSTSSSLLSSTSSTSSLLLAHFFQLEIHIVFSLFGLLDKVVFDPKRVPGPLQTVAASGIHCLFVYTPTDEDLQEGAHIQEGWVYGAKKTPAPYAFGTGKAGKAANILKGELFCYERMLFQHKLEDFDAFFGYNPTHPEKSTVKRGVVEVVIKTGTSRTALWYYMADPSAAASVPTLCRPDYQPGVLYLCQFPRSPHVLTISPFALKLESFFRLNGVKYESIEQIKFSQKSGWTPFIEENGQQMDDTGEIMRSFEKSGRATIDRSLSPAEKAITHAVSTMMEEHFIKTVFYWRYAKRMDTFVTLAVGPKFNKIMPPSLQEVWRMNQPNRTLERSVKGQLLRGGEDTLFRAADEDVRALSALLGDKDFFFGKQPHALDCIVFAHLAQVVYMPKLKFPFAQDFLQTECRNLLGFMERFKNRLWPDWETLASQKL
eukprot:g33932.t1